jgi:hypothetical protein
MHHAGQMAVFIKFVTVTGLFEKWVEDCPLEYKESQRIKLARHNWDVGCYRLSGPWRYAHIAMRAAAGNPRARGG